VLARLASVSEQPPVTWPSTARVSWRRGFVAALGRTWPGSVEVDVRLADGTVLRALAHPALVGDPRVGESVLVTVGPLERGLGTGGLALVAALPDQVGTASAAPVDRPGHLVKARYTPLQPMVLGVDEQDSQHHAVLRDADDLAAMPVVVADLHSSVPAVLAGLRARRPDARVAYVLTDGGALPAWFSRTVAGLREAGWLAATISVGQAFGGDLEAVTVHTGLLAARAVVGADVAVVVQGPGNLGTGTRWGFSGVGAGEAVNAAAVLGGRPVAALRVSGADPRERHRGVSHHSLTAYGRVALVAADVVVPVLDDVPGVSTELAHAVREQAAPLGAPTGRHRLVHEPCEGLLDALSASPVRLSTMGRDLAADPSAFVAAAAAGRHAARLLEE
jgi:hypothetical protein